MDIVKVPASAQTVKADSNLVKVAQVQTSGDTLTTNTLEGNISKASEKKLFSLDFRTSMYNTFSTKVEAMVNPSRIKHRVYNVISNYTLSYTNTEPFDKFEAARVSISADLYNTLWYREILAPVGYVNYPVKPEITIDWRTISVTGPESAPLKAVELTSTLEFLTEGDVKTKTFNYSSNVTSFYYMVGVYTYRDHGDLVNKAAYYRGKYANDSFVNSIYTSTYFSMYVSITYSLKLDYILPGLNKKTSSPLIKFDL